MGYDPNTGMPTDDTGSYTSTDPNASLSNQNIMDMIRRKQQAMAPPAAPANNWDTMSAGDIGKAIGRQGPGNDQANNWDTMSAAQIGQATGTGTGASPSSAINVPSNQDTIIGNSAYQRTLTPEQKQAILAATAGDSSYNSKPMSATVSNPEGYDTSYTSTPGRRIPLQVAQSLAAKQQLADFQRDSNNQAELNNQRAIARAQVPGQNAVAVQNAKTQGALQVGAQDNTNSMQKWNDPSMRAQREAVVTQMAAQNGLTQAETKQRLAQIDNMSSPQTDLIKSVIGFASTRPDDPQAANIVMSALNSIPAQGGQGAAPGASPLAGVTGAVQQSVDAQKERNTDQFEATDPYFQQQVKALKGAKPGLPAQMLTSFANTFGSKDKIGNNDSQAQRLANDSQSQWIKNVQQVQGNLMTIAARKNLNGVRLHQDALKAAGADQMR